MQAQEQALRRTAPMPRLSTNLASCVRWRWQDLQEMVEKQLEMMATEDAGNGQHRHEPPQVRAEAFQS